MKLFVWNNPYRVYYGGSLLFAIADNLEEAKKIAFTSKFYKYGEYEHMTPELFEVGAPTRILDLPCAEWYEWSE